MEQYSNLKKKSDECLISDLKALVDRERQTLTKVLHHLKEIEFRKLFLARGYPSLFEWMCSELGYSEAAAYRRIAAMRLIKEVPEVERDIKSGKMSLSVASQVQSYFKKENQARQMTRRPPMPKAEKQTLIKSLKGTSSRECERKLIELAPETNLPRDKVRPLTKKDFLIQCKATEGLMRKIHRLQNLLSHQVPKNELGPLLEKVVDIALEKLDPEIRQAKRERKNRNLSKKSIQLPTPTSEMDCTESASVKGRTPISIHPPTPIKVSGLPQSDTQTKSKPDTSNTKAPTRNLPQALRDYIWKRDQSKCQFRDPKTGKVCGSRDYLEIDHRYPFALGGEGTAENLRLMCRGHNIYRMRLF